MDTLRFLEALAMPDGAGPQLQSTLVRLVAAAVLSGFLAFRPWRMLLARARPVRAEIAQSQLLIGVAGVIMVVVIGDSVARAFGLVGLGACVRFRSGIKDPRDAAGMFMMIGVGMSCGLGLITVAALITGFSALVMFILDARMPETV